MSRNTENDTIIDATWSPSVNAAPRDPGALTFIVSMLIAGLWVCGVLATAFVMLGGRLFALPPLQLAAIFAAAFLPALMAWFSGASAREAARARAEAQRLADATDRLLNPAQAAEDSTRKLANSVRAEIKTLDHALEETLARIRDVEGMISRQAQAVQEMRGQAKANAGEMISGMESERAELNKISRDLSQQAQMIGDYISRHTSVISQAAQKAEAEVRAADQALDNRLTSFGAAAALITDRTNALTGAAQASADSALRLETALSNALDVLGKASELTDSARASADAASVAANSTAGALRESTQRAVEDAKRAAELIRGEAVNVERDAAAALERLRDAAEAAREAAIGARNAVEAEPPRRQRSRPEPNYEEWDEPAPPQPEPRQRRRGDANLFGNPPPRDAEPAAGGNWTWRDLLSSVDEPASASQNRQRTRAPAADPVARLQQTISEPRNSAPSLPITTMIEQSGLRFNDAFSGSTLERIAQRARSGTQARRRAVRDAAPEAVRRLGEYLAQNAHANQEAMQFLRSDGARIAELLARGRAAMGAEATRAFLLIDSAAG